tara:strand:- start:844 stop:2319 length:1476 start_codon:yes stop_codon:yes gene_type:complete
MGSVFQLQEDQPLDLSQMDHIVDPEEYNQAVHEAIRLQLKNGGLVSPTDNITNFQLESPDRTNWLEDIMNTVLKNDPAALDEPGERDTYLQRRFEFITAHEGWRDKTYRDTRNLRTVGYGFNLEEPTNRDLYKQALGKTDQDFNDLRDGKTTLDKREGRILFEAAAGSAERLISSKFDDVDLKGYERLALISLAYNHPKLIGPNLTKHIKAGDKQAAMDEIQLRSNLHKSKGIANRRELEAQMFSGMDPDDQQGSGFSLASVLGISTAEAATLRSSDDLIDRGREFQSALQTTPGRKPEPPKEKTMGSWLSGIVPSAVRALASDLLDTDLETTRNEDYFGEDEKTALRDITIAKINSTGKKSGSIEYKDYETGQKDVTMGGSSGLVKILTGDDEYSIKTTLGQYSYMIDDRGHLIVTDRYNFNDAKRLQKENPTNEDKVSNLMQYIGSGQAGGYGVVRRIGSLWGSTEGKGASFRIDLGPVSDQRIEVAAR